MSIPCPREGLSLRAGPTGGQQQAGTGRGMEALRTKSPAEVLAVQRSQSWGSHSSLWCVLPGRACIQLLHTPMCTYVGSHMSQSTEDGHRGWCLRNRNCHSPESSLAADTTQEPRTQEINKLHIFLIQNQNLLESQGHPKATMRKPQGHGSCAAAAGSHAGSTSSHTGTARPPRVQSVQSLGCRERHPRLCPRSCSVRV